MDWSHLVLEVIECTAILVNSIGLTVVIQRLRGRAEIFNQIPDLVAQLTVRETSKLDEMLVTQAVMLRRLKAIERRLPHESH